MVEQPSLDDLLSAPGITIAPGVYDGISALLVEQLGFATGFLTGSGLSNSRLARPDVGYLSLPDVEEAATQIISQVDIPIWVDADTGYGNAVNVYDTVERIASTNAAAIMIEDQQSPKRCGHMDGKSVIPMTEGVSKIRAASDARDDVAPDMLIKARTDAAGTHGIDEAIRRMNAYSEAGADILFPDAVLTEESITRTADELQDGYLSINMGFGIRKRPTTPLLSPHQLEEMGVDAVIYPRLITAAAAMGMREALESLQESTDSKGPYEDPDKVFSWEEYMDLINMERVEEREERYSVPPGQS